MASSWGCEGSDTVSLSLERTAVMVFNGDDIAPPVSVRPRLGPPAEPIAPAGLPRPDAPAGTAQPKSQKTPLCRPQSRPATSATMTSTNTSETAV
ncbi:hypothetical protein GCM10010191_75530 [Actinomadura vinacea]|uniref:Uncharacterized protein n=1 Tax=Actinomadura vinacea TaxID=115336 RepID=A0ABN3K2T9_9ACTN